MHPELFTLFGVTIYTYGFLFALGVGVSFLLSLARVKKAGLDGDAVFDVFFWTVVWGAVGSKLLLVVTNPEMLTQGEALQNLFRSGGTFYGAILAGLPALIILAHRKRLPLLPIADMVAPFVALGHSFGRLGCFCAGCCFGRPTAGPLSVVFTNPVAFEKSGTPLHVHLFPSQLVEAIFNFLNFLILNTFYLKRKKKTPGTVLALYILNYAVIRFFLEYFRGDEDRGFLLGSLEHPWSSLSTSQGIALAGFFGALLFLIFRRNTSADHGNRHS